MLKETYTQKIKTKIKEKLANKKLRENCIGTKKWRKLSFHFS